MFLRKIELEDVRGIRHLELPLTREDGKVRKWTLILGQNGTDKSTILRAIGLVLAGRDALADLIGEPDSWIRDGARKCSIRAELTTQRGERRAIALRIKRGQGKSEVLDANRDSLMDLERALSHSARNYLMIGYGVSRRLSDERFGIPKSEVFHDPRAQSVATLFSAEATLVSFESWAMDLEYRRAEKGLALVRGAFKEFLPDVDFEGIDRERRQLLFRTPDGVLPLRLLSDGYQNVIAWCGDLVHRITSVFEDYERPLEARGLLVLDEIDLHLHPVWQRNLIGFLTKKLPNFQMIATTHSPFTAQQADEGELFGLQRANSRGPRLEAFSGVPKKLLLHQLLMTPIFSSLTMSSREYERRREEYRSLKAKKRKSAAEKARFEELETELLADHPDWSMTPPIKREIEAVLEKVRSS